MVETNLKSVDYLDVTLDLETGNTRPYRKPNDTPLYINTHSTHPPTVIKYIPQAIEKRISSLSSNDGAFRQAAPMYNEALKKSSYSTEIK